MMEKIIGDTNGENKGYEEESEIYRKTRMKP